MNTCPLALRQMVLAVAPWDVVYNALSHLELRDDLGIGALGLSLWNFFVGQRRANREPLRADVCKSLDDLTSAITLLSDDIEKHLCHENGRKSKEDIYRGERRVQELEEDLARKLPVCAELIHRGYTDWWRAATSDGFPVQSARTKFARSSARVATVIDARASLVEKLQTVRHGCVTGKIKYW